MAMNGRAVALADLASAATSRSRGATPRAVNPALILGTGEQRMAFAVGPGA